MKILKKIWAIAAMLCLSLNMQAQVPKTSLGLSLSADGYYFSDIPSSVAKWPDQFIYDQGYGYSLGANAAFKVHKKWQFQERMVWIQRNYRAHTARKSGILWQQSYLEMGAGMRYFILDLDDLLLSIDGRLQYSFQMGNKTKDGQQWNGSSGNNFFMLPVAVSLHQKVSPSFFAVARPYVTLLRRYQEKRPGYYTPWPLGFEIELNYILKPKQAAN